MNYKMRAEGVPWDNVSCSNSCCFSFLSASIAVHPRPARLFLSPLDASESIHRSEPRPIRQPQMRSSEIYMDMNYIGRSPATPQFLFLGVTAAVEGFQRQPPFCVTAHPPPRPDNGFVPQNHILHTTPHQKSTLLRHHPLARTAASFRKITSSTQHRTRIYPFASSPTRQDNGFVPQNHILYTRPNQNLPFCVITHSPGQRLRSAKPHPFPHNAEPESTLLRHHPLARTTASFRKTASSQQRRTRIYPFASPPTRQDSGFVPQNHILHTTPHQNLPFCVITLSPGQRLRSAKPHPLHNAEPESTLLRHHPLARTTASFRKTTSSTQRRTRIYPFASSPTRQDSGFVPQNHILYTTPNQNLPFCVITHSPGQRLRSAKPHPLHNAEPESTLLRHQPRPDHGFIQASGARYTTHYIQKVWSDHHRTQRMLVIKFWPCNRRKQ